MATSGIQDVAEQGNNSQFMNEVNNAKTNTNSDQWLQQGFSGGALGTSTLYNLEISEDYPLLTLVSMIAPSPDWFIGVNSLSLLDASNDWKNSIEIDMFVYDSGTDSGTNYDSSNVVTTPQENISSLEGVSPFSNNKIGSLTITLKSVLNVEKFNNLNKIMVSPNPSNGNITISNIQQIDLNKIEIYNVLGKLIISKTIKSNTNSINLNLESHNSGIYLIKLVAVSGESKTKKLLIQ